MSLNYGPWHTRGFLSMHADFFENILFCHFSSENTTQSNPAENVCVVKGPASLSLYVSLHDAETFKPSPAALTQ